MEELKQKLVPEVKEPLKASSIASVKKPSLKKKTLDSFILDGSTEENRAQLSFLLSSLNHPRSLKLLFRASEHYFRAKAFHKKCDGVSDTVTLVKTEFGKVIAGYSHYQWDEVDGSLKDESKKAFLLQLDRR